MKVYDFPIIYNKSGQVSINLESIHVEKNSLYMNLSKWGLIFELTIA